MKGIEEKLHRPYNDSDFPQKKIEKDVMSYMVFFGTSKTEAYMRFYPHLVDRKTGKLNEVGELACKNFFSLQINKKYIEDYEKTLLKWFKGVKLSKEVETISDSRKDNALKMLFNQAMKMVESGKDLDPDSLKVVTEIFKKLNLINSDIEEQEKPRRYLPLRCMSECGYRLFVESNIEKGNIINECEYCKTRKFAEANGWRFDMTHNLELPINNTTDETSKV